MTDKFMSAVLAALNETSELTASDWNLIKAALPVRTAAGAALDARTQASENRFAATISFGMEKIRQIT
jgi:hypothetical protein